MLWKDRALSMLLAAAVTAAAAAAAVRFAPEKPRFTETQLQEGITYETSNVAADAVVASVDGNGAEAELLTYQIGSICSYLDYMLRTYTGEGLDTEGTLPSGESVRDYVLGDALDTLKNQLVLENLCERYGVTLSAEEEAALAEEIGSYVEMVGGEDALRAQLYTLGLSQAGYERLTRAAYLYAALYDSYCTPGSALYADDDVLHAYAAGLGYITADHILLATIDLATREPLDGETAARKRQLAEDILWQLRDSADPVALFDELADAYSEDTGRAAYPEGYTFKPDDNFVPEFKDAAYALEEYEYSDIVESDYGYHILLRRPLNVPAAAEAVREEYFAAFFSGEVERAKLVTEPEVERFDVSAIYEAFRKAQEAVGP